MSIKKSNYKKVETLEPDCIIMDSRVSGIVEITDETYPMLRIRSKTLFNKMRGKKIKYVLDGSILKIFPIIA